MQRRWTTLLAYLVAATGLTFGQAPPDKALVMPKADVGAPVLSTPWGDGCCKAEPRCPRSWASADYLIYWIKGTPTPPLVTTGTAPDVLFGVLGQPNTRLLFGDEKVESDARHGFRLSGGRWFGCDDKNGIEGSFFWLNRASRQQSFNGDANGEPFIGRPFIDAQTGQENVFFASVSNALSQGFPLIGGVSVSTDTRVYGFEANLARKVYDCDTIRVTALAGFRSLTLKESLTIRETYRDDIGAGVFLNQAVPPTSTTNILDDFATQNNFYGGQVGARLDWRFCRLAVSATGKIAFGATDELTSITGATTLVTPTGPLQSAPAGILATASNNGSHFDRDFAVVPEAGLNVSYDVTNWLNVRAGYSFLYWSKVVRPGDQVDRTVNLNQVPTDVLFGTPGGPARPAYPNDKTDFWLHGVNLGVELKF